MRVLLFLTILTIAGHADWRTDALNRISKHRKTNLQIKVVDKAGLPLNNVSVSIKLTKHQFPFGAVIRSTQLYGTPYSDIYKENYKKYFNAAGASLGLKPKWWGTANEESVDTAFQWFKENNFYYRGHAFIWEGEEFLPPEQKEIYNATDLTNQQKADSLIPLMEAYMDHAMERWDLRWWDVVNEPVVNNIINELLPEQNTFTHWFKLADSLRAKYNRDEVKLVLNENQIISNNAKWVEGKIENFMTIIDTMLAQGAPLEMLGFQSRIKYGMLSPDTMYQRLIAFEKYNMPYQATEFEIRNSNNYTYTDAEVKQLTEEFLLTYFSHPRVEGIWHWTFVEKAPGTEHYALFNYDGTPTPTGEKWIELMEGVLMTDTTLTTNENGTTTTRGYYGTYDLEITYKDTTLQQKITLQSNTSLTITISDEAESLLTHRSTGNAKPYLLSKSNIIKRDHQTGPMGVEIFSLRGQLIQSVVVGKQRLSLRELNLAEGIYQVRIAIGSQHFVESLIVQ